MNPTCERLLGRLVLRHATDSEQQAEAICREGFHLSRKPLRHNLRKPATWFYHVTAFGTGEMTVRPVGFLLAVDLAAYVRGRDYAHEMNDVVVFHVPLPPNLILARLRLPIPDRQTLTRALNDQWQCDVITELVRCCCDSAVPWGRKTAMAEMLWSLDAECYVASGVLGHLLAAEVPGLDIAQAQRLGAVLAKACPRFLKEFLRLYHKVFLTPHFARAAMVAAARAIAPMRILELADGSGIPRASTQDEALQEFLGAVLPPLRPHNLVKGAIELAAMRHFPGDASDIQAIADWIVGREGDAEDVAFHYVRFAGDTFPERHAAHVARNLAVRLLQATGNDHFGRLLSLGDTDYPETRLGVAHAFGKLQEERAVPFLVSCLKDDRKQQRAAAVRALGQIGSPNALAAIEAVANDKARIVQKAAEEALGKQ